MHNKAQKFLKAVGAAYIIFGAALALFSSFAAAGNVILIKNSEQSISGRALPFALNGAIASYGFALVLVSAFFIFSGVCAVKYRSDWKKDKFLFNIAAGLLVIAVLTVALMFIGGEAYIAEVISVVLAPLYAAAVKLNK